MAGSAECIPTQLLVVKLQNYSCDVTMNPHSIFLDHVLRWGRIDGLFLRQLRVGVSRGSANFTTAQHLAPSTGKQSAKFDNRIVCFSRYALTAF